MDSIRGRYKTALSLLGLSDASLEITEQQVQRLPARPEGLEF
jgi:hypothetical protein